MDIDLNKYNCRIFLSETSKIKDVYDFLIVLGFKKYDRYNYYLYDKRTMQQKEPVWAMVLPNFPIEVITQTDEDCSIKDFEIHNWTVRQLKRRFGGYFKSRQGRNRYPHFEGVKRRNAEAACYLAYYYFKYDIGTLRDFLSVLKKSENSFNEFHNDNSPLISSTNLGLPFIVTSMEEYLRNTYVALLIYAPNKREIYKSSKIITEELTEVSNNNISIEEVFSRSKSFQNTDRINENFKELIKGLNFVDALKRYNPRFKYLDKLNQIIEKRHNLIHRFQLDIKYTIKDFERDLFLIENIVRIFYIRIIEINKWQRLLK